MRGAAPAHLAAKGRATLARQGEKRQTNERVGGAGHRRRRRQCRPRPSGVHDQAAADGLAASWASVLRALQGFFGGVLIPLAFTITLTMLPRTKQPVGMAMFMLSATFAPAIGPTIGGYLTETYGWQYIFYVNLVPGAIMLVLLVPSLPRVSMRAAAAWRLARHRRAGDRPGVAPDGALPLSYAPIAS